MMKIVLLMLALCAVVNASAVQTPAGKQPAEPKVYWTSESFGKLARLPGNVLDVLLASVSKDQYIEAALQETPQKDRNDYFEATEVHLANSDEVDYVVVGLLPLAGADNQWFWVARARNAEKPVILLFDGTDKMEILEGKHHGLRDIRTIWSSGPSHIEKYFHFDGVKYVLAGKVDR